MRERRGEREERERVALVAYGEIKKLRADLLRASPWTRTTMVMLEKSNRFETKCWISERRDVGGDCQQARGKLTKLRQRRLGKRGWVCQKVRQTL